ncbi:uncharacterized protein A4U43_C10F13800 [Asparagus officinalis]|uniref:Uncharacterized protein n=1 Tax=Asparagus officinalis TaxID=4686 RepID=A0A5P1E5X4_ASPOF|nr:uncharacterized protein A4U43_C10F13800 [Asparagus officinalis]
MSPHSLFIGTQNRALAQVAGHLEVARFWPSHLEVARPPSHLESGSRFGSKSALEFEFESVLWLDDSLTHRTVSLIPHASGCIPLFACGSLASSPR